MKATTIDLCLALMTFAIGLNACSSAGNKTPAEGSGGTYVTVGGQTGGAGGNVIGSGGGPAQGDAGVSSTEGGWQFASVQIPPGLSVPSGATLKTRLHAIGVQIYNCVAMAGTDPAASTFAWTLKAPDAKLFDSAGFPVGKHSQGPTWAHKDGSAVVGAKVAQADSPEADAIPWLLLRAVSNSGAGTLSDITFVHRVNTYMGKAPGAGCSAATVGGEVHIDYIADYYFYTGGNPAGDGGADAAWAFTPIAVPATLAVPEGAALKVKLHATGVQIYTCTATPSSSDGGALTHAWTLKAPEATLYDEQRNTVGTHGQGPSWTAADGSTVVGTRRALVDSPDADAIPWLLLGATSRQGAGLFGDVTFVQRVNTAKGRAPTGGCDAASEALQTRVDYTADYYFYTGGEAGSAATAEKGHGS